MAKSVQSFDEYADLVRKSGIVEKNRLEAILSAFEQMPEGRPSDSFILAKRLMEDKLVTPWQNSHLLGGRSKGFFLGKYKLLNFLGTGGMSTVYLAEHIMMRRQVAIKVLLGAQVEQSRLERFHRECRAIAGLDHPNIVRAHDFDSDGKFHYLVMEFVEGCDLQSLVEKQGPLPHAEAADYIRQAADGLQHAHEAGMIHRDIKPANLLRDAKGVIKILDMGVARITNRDEVSLTLAGDEGMLGTVDYLSPEQALDSHNVDVRADIYSLGCTLYFLLTGNPPFSTGTQAQRLLAHQVQQPKAVSEIRQDVPSALIDICNRMIAKKPDDRYQTAGEVSRALASRSNGDSTAREENTSVIEASQSSSQQRTSAASTDTEVNSQQKTLAKIDGSVRTACTGCGAQFKAPSSAIGKRVRCPRCQAVFPVTASDPE